jgi:hypothetical protein
MKTFFGKSEPTAFDVLSGTFGQILSSGPSAIRVETKSQDHTFYADTDWIIDVSTLMKTLGGGLVPYPERGVNVCRIETAYRYLYRNIFYGDIESINMIKDGDILFNEQWRLGKEQYVLILREFGQYKWDERPEVIQL